MGGGNGAKAATARARKAAEKKTPGSQLKVNAAALSIVCAICRQQFMTTSSMTILKQHAESKHPKNKLGECFPDKATEA